MATTTFLTIEQLRTWCKVTPGQAKPVTALSAAGGVATATIPNHGFRHGDTVAFAGASPVAYNGAHLVSVIDGSTVTFPLPGTPAEATGTITARPDHDAVLQLLADRVCAGLERATSRVFVARDLEDAVPTTGQRTVVLRGYPVLDLHSLTLDGAPVPTTQYVLHRAMGTLMSAVGTWPRGATLAASYRAGMEEVGADVVGVALDVVAYLYSRHTTGGALVSSINIGPSGISIQQGLPRDLRDAIAALRDTRLG